MLLAKEMSVYITNILISITELLINFLHPKINFMKNLLFTLILFLSIGISNQIIAQVQEETKEMSLGVRNALVITIPNVSEKLAGKIWKTYTKDFYDSKTKWNRRASEWITAEADIVALGMGNDVNLYVRLEEKKDDVIFSLWIDTGNAFINKTDHPKRYREGEKLVLRYALELAQAKIKLDMAEEEKKKGKMESQLKKLISAQKRYERNIEKAKAAIKKAEQNIVDNKKEQEDSTKEIATQAELIDTIRKKLNDL